VARAAAAPSDPAEPEGGEDVDWHRRVVGRSLQSAQRRSIDRATHLIRAAAKVLERNGGASLTVQEVADEAGQSLRTLYQYFESKDDLLLAVHEEAMRTYARLLRAAVDGIDAPLERLAAGIIASARLPELHDKAGFDRGLSNLRLQLGQAAPDLLARSQQPVTALFRELVSAALDASGVSEIGVDQAVYMLSSLRASYVRSTTLGDDLGVDLPDAVDLSCFCLAGLGSPQPRKWHEAVQKRMRLDGSDGRSILRRLASEAPAS
jgi:AcrR family transcriptional regulator